MSEQPPASDPSRASTAVQSQTPPFDGSQSVTDLLKKAGQSSSVDLTKYKSQELKKRFQELFGVVHLLPWAGVGLGGTIVLLLILWAVLFIPTAPFIIAMLALVYMFLQGFFLGILAAALLVLARIFQQLTAIVDLTIQSLRQLFSDVGQLTDSKVRSELVAGFIHGAVIPAVQGAITVKLGLIRAPISFVINKILGRTAKKLTKTLAKDAEPTTESLPSTELASAPGESHLDRMQERIEVISRRTKKATLIPATIFFIAAATFSSIPWLLVFFGFLQS